MRIASKLGDLLTDDEVVSGVVVSISATPATVNVATKKGIKTYPYVGAVYINDRVIIRDGIALRSMDGKVFYC